MNMLKKIIIIFVSLICLVGCDLTTKHIAQNELKGQPVQSYLGGSVKLFYIENPGGMLSFGDNLPGEIKIFIFQVFVSIILITLLFYMIKKKNLDKLQMSAFILFLSGGLGNLIDRITNEGRVIDFIILEVLSYHTGIFNIADFYVTIGIIILVLHSLSTNQKPQKIKF